MMKSSPAPAIPAVDLAAVDAAYGENNSSLLAMRGLGSSAAFMIGALLFSRAIGFVRSSLLAHYFGSNRLTDCYVYAFTIPDLVLQLLFAGAPFALFVPVLTRYFDRDEEQSAWTTASTLLLLAAAFLAALLPALWFFAPSLLRLLAPQIQAAGSPPTVLLRLNGQPVSINPIDLTVELTRILLPSEVFFVVGALLMSCQQARGRFWIPALGTVICNFAIIGCAIFLHHRLGIASFAWGALLGSFAGSLILQAWGVVRLKPRFKFRFDWRHPGVRECLRLFLPVMLGFSLPQVHMFVNGYFVSGFLGGRSSLDYASRVVQLPLSVFAPAIATVLLPTLSRLAGSRDWPAFRSLLGKGIQLVLFLTVPVTILLYILADPVLRLIYQHGNFSEAGTRAAAPVLRSLSLGLVPWSLQVLLTSACFALSETGEMVLAATFVTVCFVVLDYFMVQWFSVRGAALATSIAAVLDLAALWAIVSRRAGSIGGQPLVVSCARIGFSTIVMGLVVWGGRTAVGNLHPQGLSRNPGEPALLIGAGLAAYILIQMRLKAPEIAELTGFLRQRASASGQGSPLSGS